MNWRIADWLSRLLEPAEREAVLGDIAESHECGGQAVRDLLGLAVRRQAALWLGWRPWAILAVFVVPVAARLSVTAFMSAHAASTPIWMYANNWTWTYLNNPRARMDLVEIGGNIVLTFVTLACWSWGSGFVLGFLSRRSIPFLGALFVLVTAQPQLFWRPAGPDPEHSAVYALAFYSTIFPLLVLLALAVLPAIWGMRHGLQLPSHSAGFQRILRSVSVAALVLLMLRGWIGRLPEFLVPYYVQLAGQHGQRLRVLSLLTYWPVTYLVANAIAQRWTAQEKNS
ncbi:MAG TPA: hypothetical protein VMH80_05055 [Bryobacteraceae bacterium]|nr:hypothetical protein [Bryobacteraceae bacterium]